MNVFKNGKIKSLLPFFLLAIAVIIVFKIISEIGFFAGLVKNIWSIVTPFFYGFLLAYIINIPYSGIKAQLKKTKIKFINKRRKLFSIIITIMFFSLIIFSIIYFIVPYIFNSISYFITNLPSYYERVRLAVDYINSLGLPNIHISTESIMLMLQEIFQNISVDNFSSTINAVFGVSSAIFTGFLAFISSIYILAEKEKFKIFIRRVISVFATADISDVILKYTGRLNSNFKRYIHIQTIDGCILGTIVTIELLILRSPYALFLGIMLGIVNYIPYFGSIFGTFFVVIIVAFTQGITVAAIAIIILLITQQIDGNIIQPRLMGGSFSLSPLLIIISITIGGAAAGIFGMIAAIPIVAVLKDILENFINYHEQKKQSIKHLNEP
ncbi:MAG: AI-2E family transporter [Treponema sp.]|nr:AI-2E family transporter [Treponema sp.]